MTRVVLVDSKDAVIGEEDKTVAHLGAGSLHRAFTIFIFNNKGQTLIAQRSKAKMLWPLVWDSACASHPNPGEGQTEAGERRLLEELGFTCKLKEADKFEYHEKYLDIGSENEICTTLLGEYDGPIEPVDDEVAAFKWINITDLVKEIESEPEKYSIWLRIALDRLLDKGLIKGDVDR